MDETINRLEVISDEELEACSGGSGSSPRTHCC
jgi:hypothetical protein